jgi:hypothetical protein
MTETGSLAWAGSMGRRAPHWRWQQRSFRAVPLRRRVRTTRAGWWAEKTSDGTEQRQCPGLRRRRRLRRSSDGPPPFGCRDPSGPPGSVHIQPGVGHRPPPRRAERPHRRASRGRRCLGTPLGTINDRPPPSRDASFGASSSPRRPFTLRFGKSEICSLQVGLSWDSRPNADRRPRSSR